MHVLFLDSETFYDSSSKYSLRNRAMNMTLYHTDPRFEVLAVGALRLNGCGESDYSDWLHDRPGAVSLRDYLLSLDYENAIVLAHHAIMDVGGIKRVTGLMPRQVICTQMLATYALGSPDEYAVYRNRPGGANTLDSLGQLLVGDGKVGGGDVLDRMSNRRDVFGTEVEAEYLAYLRDDVEKVQVVWQAYGKQFPKLSKFLSDWAVRQFVTPKLHLDRNRLTELATEETERINELCRIAGHPKATFNSNDKFAALLAGHGVAVPMKHSVKQKKSIPALAQNDVEFSVLCKQYADGGVVDRLLQARLAVKSNQLVTRSVAYQKVHDATGGEWPVDLMPSGAHTNRPTGRSGGGGSPLNMGKKSGLRDAIVAPPGKRILRFDYVAFELFISRWVARDVAGKLMLMTEGLDLYVETIARALSIEPSSVTEALRQAGKVLALSSQYGVGWKTMGRTLLVNPKVDREFQDYELKHMVSQFRHVLHPAVPQAWDVLERWLWNLARAQTHGGHDWRMASQTLPGLDLPPGTTTNHLGVQWPSGRTMEYRNLIQMDKGALAKTPLKNARPGLFYRPRGESGQPKPVYGAAVLENFAQSLAAEIMDRAMMRIETELGLDVALQVYDECVLVIDKPDSVEALMRTVEDVRRVVTDLSWWPDGPPLSVDFTYGERYGSLQEIT